MAKKDEKCPDHYTDPDEQTNDEITALLEKVGKKFGDVLHDANLFAAAEHVWIKGVHPENGGPPKAEEVTQYLAYRTLFMQLETYGVLKDILKEIKKR